MLNPLFKWFGSKWSSAKRYVQPLEGSLIIEPFAGGAGYSLNHSEHDVIIWDENTQLQELWSWLINDAKQRDVLDIPINLPVGTDILSLGLSRGQSLLLKHWQRTNTQGKCFTISPWGNKPGQWTANTRARIAEEIEGIKHWKFQKPSWTETATWFIDPPYLYNYRYGYNDFDHAELARAIQTLPNDSLVIACEATCKKTGQIPDYLPFVENHKQVTSRRKATNSHHSNELVYVRYPVFKEV